MTPEVVEVARRIAAAENFFSCGKSAALVTSQLPAIFDDIIRDDASVVPGEQLTCLLHQIQDVTSRASQLISGRPEALLAANPHPGRWSAAECFDHLARTTQVFLPPIKDAIAAAPRLASKRRMRAGTLASLLTRGIEPPYRLKHKVPRHLAPQHRDFPPAWSAFLNSQAHLSRALRSAAGLAIDEVKIKSPMCPGVSYNAYGALGILAAHQRRHLWQAEQVLKALDRSAA
jgi:DinB superfamily